MSAHPIGRLAMRIEGDLWEAYYARPDTMHDALFLGSIQLRFVQDSDRKALFMALMQDAVSDLLKATTGTRPGWSDPHPAPEQERQ